MLSWGPQELLVGGREPGPRVNAQFLGQPAAYVVVGLQRLVLPASPRERAQVQRPDALPQGMPSRQLTELARQESQVVGLVTGFEPRIRSGLQRGQP
ncbi:hypothetical protein GCM10020220_106660 [Nonomuraea rubra]